MKFENSTFIITGGASGLGEATVRRFHGAGANVVIADLNSERGAYDPRQADRDYDRLSGTSIDHVLELSHVDKRRVHQLKYFSWVEQLGKSVDELRAQWEDHRNYWSCLRTQSAELDALIDEFNAEVAR